MTIVVPVVRCLPVVSVVVESAQEAEHAPILYNPAPFQELGLVYRRKDETGALSS